MVEVAVKRWILVEEVGIPHTQTVRGRLPPVGGVGGRLLPVGDGLLPLGGKSLPLRGRTLPVGAYMFSFLHLKELCGNEVINPSNK